MKRLIASAMDQVSATAVCSVGVIQCANTGNATWLLLLPAGFWLFGRALAAMRTAKRAEEVKEVWEDAGDGTVQD
jgi:hypothetical protein